MARSIVSLGMFASRAATTAARRRGFAAGSGSPVLAATVSSRMILVKTLARFASCAPLRYMMFLNCERPAMTQDSGTQTFEIVAGKPTILRGSGQDQLIKLGPEYGR